MLNHLLAAGQNEHVYFAHKSSNGRSYSKTAVESKQNHVNW